MKKSRSAIVKAFVMISQIGVSMLVSIFLGAWIGYQLDKWLKSSLLFLIFLLFGIMAAFRNVYRMLAPFFITDLEKEKKQQAYWDALHPDRKQAEKEPEAEPEESGVVLRRKREALSTQPGPVKEGCEEKSSRQEAEEEFDAWRRKRESGRNE